MALLVVNSSFLNDWLPDPDSNEATLDHAQTVTLKLQITGNRGDAHLKLFRRVGGGNIQITRLDGTRTSDADPQTSVEKTVDVEAGDYFLEIGGSKAWTWSFTRVFVTGIMEYEQAASSSPGSGLGGSGSPLPGGPITSNPGAPSTGGGTGNSTGGTTPGGPIPVDPGTNAPGLPGWWSHLSTTKKVAVGGGAVVLLAGAVFLAVEAADRPKAPVYYGGE